MPNQNETVSVDLTYFKATGKFYTNGSLEVPKAWITENKHWLVYGEVRALLQTRKLPGLTAGHSNYIVHVGEPCIPQLIIDGWFDE